MSARFPRAAGVLAHPTSLPGEWGPGDLGDGALQFLDFLQRGGQRIWQVLPLTPPDSTGSPYASPSAFAGNPDLVTLAPLLGAGWLGSDDLRLLAEGDATRAGSGKRLVLAQAADRFRTDATAEDRERFYEFRAENASWLEDFALFAALHDAYQASWLDWPESLRRRDPLALAEAHQRYAPGVERQAFAQFVFFDQWSRIRAAAHVRGIRILGDLPIFVSLDSADAWAHGDLFQLDAQGRPTRMAGVPPDYFSETGQLWGNPLYRWDRMAEDGYAWWVARVRQLLRLVDLVRIDHFRGFAAAWAVPAGADTAREGEWQPGPGAAPFQAMARSLGSPLPIVAEDLGLITDDVRELLCEVEFPGMKVLQFAFDSGPDNLYLPHKYTDPNCVVYTGTHDNDTTRGWYNAAPEETRAYIRAYARADDATVVWDLIRLAYSSVADTAIVPLQDVLDLGSEARMNVPGTSAGNWAWKVAANDLNGEVADRLAAVTWTYGRAGSSDR